MKYASTGEITLRSEYKASPEAFFGMFSSAWSAARCQVAKLETRQTYQEPDNDSCQRFLAGDEAGALSILEQVRAIDDDLYSSLNERGIDFVRCRPISFPMSDYLRWETHVYRHNASKGERIFWCNLIAMQEFFSSHAQHDFMIFDSRIAFVHDYDSSGLIQGGWMITDSDHIAQLLSIYSFIKANCSAISQLSTNR